MNEWHRAEEKQTIQQSLCRCSVFDHRPRSTVSWVTVLQGDALSNKQPAGLKVPIERYRDSFAGSEFVYPGGDGAGIHSCRLDSPGDRLMKCPCVHLTWMCSVMGMRVLLRIEELLVG